MVAELLFHALLQQSRERGEREDKWKKITDIDENQLNLPEFIFMGNLSFVPSSREFNFGQLFNEQIFLRKSIENIQLGIPPK